MKLEHPLLAACGVRHGFGTRGDPGPAGLRRPRQVHGAAVTDAAACASEPAPEADAVVSRLAEVPVGVVTADCVPVLLSARDGGCVAAIHAGWRGLAAGVVASGARALRREAEAADWVAVVGPHAGPCCYEVDAPVLDALRRADPEALEAVVRDSRPGHWWLDLGALTERQLLAAGAGGVGRVAPGCTVCDAARFESYRRDGPRAGRLVHWIAARPGGDTRS